MYDKLIFERSKKGRVGITLPKTDIKDYALPKEHLTKRDLLLPEVSEVDVIRHYTNLSLKNYGVDRGIYPLGSCTMKYNPKINEELSKNPKFNNLHPLQPDVSSQGALELEYNLEKLLNEILGLKAFSFAPCAGAHGELTGLMMIKAYHEKNKDFKRKKIIIPDSAHGTNPASVAIVGFEVVNLQSTEDGTVDLEHLKELLDDEVAGMMLTNPNTAGLYEKDVCKITKLVHDAGGLMYYDGANFNALLGLAKPSDMGFDVIHLNLHKSFSTPHGGGGPGVGAVGVGEKLKTFLPNKHVKLENGLYVRKKEKDSIGSVSYFQGNYNVILKAYAYILSMGKENIRDVGEMAVLNANYVKACLEEYYEVPVKGAIMHEVVFNGLKSKKATTLDVAKRLLDYGFHPSTIYFPLLFSQSMMVEPVETESKETIDEFIDALIKIANEAEANPELLHNAPHTTPVRRLDEVLAARELKVKYRDLLWLM